MKNKTSAGTSSVQTRVILTTVLMITLILTAFGTYDYLSTRSAKYADLKSSAEVSATRLAATLVIPLWDLDDDLVDDTLKSEMLNRDIAALVLRDGDGTKIFAAKQRDANWEVADVAATSGFVAGIGGDTRFEHKADVLYNGEELIGQIEVYVSSRFVNQELTSSLITTIVTVLVLDLLIFLVLLMLLRSVIIKPIMHLSNSVERMSRGELDIELDFNRRDEIGLVANAIERMQVSLRIAMGRLSRAAKTNPATPPPSPSAE